MIRIKLTIAYDGTNFAGWQRQSRDVTVQETLENVLAAITKDDVRLTGSGRTDSGVHARGQIAHFDTSLENMPPERFKPAMNSLLPDSVRVLSSEQAADDFHSRFQAIKRTYQYFIREGEPVDPFLVNHAIFLNRKLDISVLNGYASHILGEHDFTTFAAAGDMCKSKTRTIYESSFHYADGFLVYKITGNAFLMKMVRSLVGTMLTLEHRKEHPRKMNELILAADRGLCGTTAPAKGLFLEQVRYGTV